MIQSSCYHNCIEELRSDHDKILEELIRLEKNLGKEGFDEKSVREFLDFTDNFAEIHHQKEEKVLFPALEGKGLSKEAGPIGVMLLEHEIKRNHINDLRKALEKKDFKAARTISYQIISLLREHIMKENEILYPMAQDILTKEDMSRISDQCKLITNQ